MTKQEEINLFKNLLTNLPKDAEYLRSILGGIELDLESAIRNDFGFVPLADIMDGCREHQKVVAELEAKANKVRAEISRLERDRERMKDGINEARKLALRVAQLN